ncbi:cupin domain-containing protein [Streptomyces sp. NPDC020742]|uniref:cupin domain-containing protein n=1 Tax=Streptomyces sp. NPDC020742 TaxID=3154897 RepID=UPI0033E00971
MDEQRTSPAPLPEALVELYGLAPLPREGGRFRQTWAGPPRPDGRPEGTAIVMLLTAEPGDFSALHRLPTDEIWHFYAGDPLTLYLLTEDDGPPGADGAPPDDGPPGAGGPPPSDSAPGAGGVPGVDEAPGAADAPGASTRPGCGGSARTVVLGPDVLGGQQVQFTVPAGTWMAAQVVDGGAWTLFGCTMAPGFTYQDYEHGDAAQLAARFPEEAARIAALSRP